MRDQVIGNETRSPDPATLLNNLERSEVRLNARIQDHCRSFKPKSLTCTFSSAKSDRYTVIGEVLIYFMTILCNM